MTCVSPSRAVRDMFSVLLVWAAVCWRDRCRGCPRCRSASGALLAAFGGGNGSAPASAPPKSGRSIYGSGGVAEGAGTLVFFSGSVPVLWACMAAVGCKRSSGVAGGC